MMYVFLPAEAKRATIYFVPDLHNALKIKAFKASRSITDIVNQAVRALLSQDAEALLAYEERRNEPRISSDQMVKTLRKDGRIYGVL